MNDFIQEYIFTLPKGLLDPHNCLYRQGKMRLTAGRDELFIQQYFAAQNNPQWADLVLLSRTIIHLGNLSSLTAELLESLFLVDLAYLKTFYRQINQQQGEVFLLGER